MTDLKAFTAAVMGVPIGVLEAAREAAAQECEQRGDSEMARMIREGHGDHHRAVTAACIAIMAERERCAEIARSTEAYDDRLQQASGFLTTGQRIARAILGQQETPNAS